MKHFIEIYDDETGVMLTKVGATTAEQATAKALAVLHDAEAGLALWFVEPKSGSTAKHLVPAGKGKKK